MTVINSDHVVLTSAAETGKHPTVTIALTVNEAYAAIAYIQNGAVALQDYWTCKAIGNIEAALRLALGNHDSQT